MVNDGTSGSGSRLFSNILKSLRDCRSYFGFALFLAVLDLIMGIVLLSRVPANKEPLMFTVVVLATVLAFSHFTSVCFLFQRRLEQKYGKYPREANLKDVGGSTGVALLFILSGLCTTIPLPSHCYPPPSTSSSVKNVHLEALGRLSCNLITATSAFSWLGVLLMSIAGITLYIEVQQAHEASKAPPPVFPTGANPHVMRWLARTPTLVSHGSSMNTNGMGSLSRTPTKGSFGSLSRTPTASSFTGGGVGLVRTPTGGRFGDGGGADLERQSSSGSSSGGGRKKRPPPLHIPAYG